MIVNDKKKLITALLIANCGVLLVGIILAFLMMF